MEKNIALSRLGKIQWDLINRKKAISSEIAKLDEKIDRIASSAKPYGNRLSYGASRDKDSLADKARHLKNSEEKMQSWIEAIIYARQFLKDH